MGLEQLGQGTNLLRVCRVNWGALAYSGLPWPGTISSLSSMLQPSHS